MYTDHLVQEERHVKVPGSWAGSSLISGLSDVAWRVFQAVNRRLPEGELPHPRWAAGKMLKSYERSSPPLGSATDTGYRRR